MSTRSPSARHHALQTTLRADPVSIGTDFEVINSAGQVIARSRPADARLAPDRIIDRVIATRRAEFTTVTIGGRTLRVYVHPLEAGPGKGSGGAVVVAASTDTVEDGLAQARWLTLVAGIAAVAVAAAACLLLTKRALRPLTRLNAEVMEVQRTADPTRRISTAPTGDEVDQLATALNAMLAALQKAREVERRFLADASHEMRTPLTALRGNAAYLAQHGADAEAFADLESDMARLAQLLDRLLAVAREDAAAPPTEPVALGAVLDPFSSDPRVELAVDDGLTVRGDADAIARAVTNLVDNAKLYGPAGGQVSISAAAEDGEVVVRVSDTGPGLSPADAEQATTRFWRGANSAGLDGAGLGLGLVRATAERHGGSLTIDGSTFAIHLPAFTDVSPRST